MEQIKKRRSIYCSKEQYDVLKKVLLVLRNIDSGLYVRFVESYGDAEVVINVCQNVRK